MARSIFRRRGGETSLQLYANQLLLLPIPLQIEQTAGQTQRPPAGLVRPVGDQWARSASRDPLFRLGPGQLGDVDRGLRLIEGCGVYRPQVDADRSIAERANGQGQRKPHALVCLAADPAHRIGGVHVGRIENARLVERREQTAMLSCTIREVLAVSVEPRRSTSSGRSCLLMMSTPSSSSESSTTSADGGRQLNTPHGTPSTRGVSGPAIPRTKR